MDIILKLSEELGIRKSQAEAAVKLIDEGNTCLLYTSHDWANQRTADLNGRNASGNAEPGHPTLSYAGTESELSLIHI